MQLSPVCVYLEGNLNGLTLKMNVHIKSPTQKHMVKEAWMIEQEGKQTTHMLCAVHNLNIDTKIKWQKI